MQILEIQNIEVKLARFTLRSSPKWIKLPKSTCFYERNRIMKKRKFEACSCQSCVKLMQMTQMDTIYFARWRELGLPGISLQVNIHIRTEISS